MDIDRKKFNKLSTEKKIMQLVRIQQSDSISQPYEAVCSICSEVYTGLGCCDGDLCWGAKKKYAYCDSDYHLFNEVPESDINRLCKELDLTFVGFMVGKNIHHLYNTDAEAQDALRNSEDSWSYGPDYTAIPPR